MSVASESLSLTPEIRTALTRLVMVGDHKAFERLYRSVHPKLLRFAHRLCGNADDAQDVMQDAAFTIVKNIGRLQNPSSFLAWCYTIVRRRSVDRMRKRGRSPLWNAEELDTVGALTFELPHQNLILTAP